MSDRHRLVSIAALLAALTSACGKTITQPSTAAPSPVESRTTALTGSVSAPSLLQPADGATIRNADQPVTLVVQNAVVTKPGGTTYTFEVATDAAFTAKVQTKDGVAEGGGGQTAVTLDPLRAATDFYWHVRAQGSGTTGVFGSTYKFTVGPAVTVTAPVPIGPLTGAQTGPRPTLRVFNAARTGPAGPITYRFEVARDPAFASIFVVATQPEGINETGFIPASDLPLNVTLYWRATASDAASGVSAASQAQSFTAKNPSQAEIVAGQLGVPLWPGAQPPGTPGHAVMGSFWTVEYLVSFDGVRFQNPPLDQVQIFDLLDRGMDPESAISWMHAHGYATQAAYYASVQVIGFAYEYMAFIGGRWDIVLKVGA